LSPVEAIVISATTGDKWTSTLQTRHGWRTHFVVGLGQKISMHTVKVTQKKSLTTDTSLDKQNLLIATDAPLEVSVLSLQ
jgi:hypothetical protein